MFSEPVQSTRSAQAERTRARVIDCAQTLFLAEGFAGTTIRRIAAEAGVSVGTVMAVGDKDALLLAAYDRWIGAVHEARVAGLIPPNKSAPAAVQVADMVQPFLDLFGAHPALAREYSAILARGGHRTDLFSSLALSLIAQFGEIMAEAGLGERSEAAGRAAYFAYIGLLRVAGSTGTPMGEVRVLLEEVVDVLVRPAD